MLTRPVLLMVAIISALVWFGNIGFAESSVPESRDRLAETGIFDKIGLAKEAEQPAVKLLPVQDTREVAVCGLINLQVPAEIFLQSFRESMVRKSDPAILEIGSFNTVPTIDDLQGLTIEPGDIDDLKRCVIGDCKVKLSAGMIERFQNEVDWTAADYRLQVTRLFKQILLDYVREYLEHGDAALIEYNDKPNAVKLAEEIHSLIATSTLAGDISGELTHKPKPFSEPGLSVVENALVWSKIKFGLKPVLAINHILIYRQQPASPQVLVVSKQIYANHYFDSSLAVTAFGNLPGHPGGSYLFYENRSRVDGLTGVFGKLKRGVIEDQALDNLQTILEKSKASLSARMSGQPEAISAIKARPNWRRWTPRVVQVCLLVLLISALIVLLVLSRSDVKSVKPASALSKLALANQPISSESHGKGRGTG